MEIAVGVSEVKKIHNGAVYSLCRAGDEAFWSAGADGQLVRWKREAGPWQAKQFAVVPSAVYSLASAGRFLAAGTRMGALYVFDVEEKKLMGQLQMHGDVFGLTGEGAVLYGGDSAGHLFAISLAEVSLLWQAKMSDDRVRCTLVLDDERVAAGFSDGHIRIISRADGSILRQWQAHSPSVFTLALSTDGRHLISGGRDAHLRLWDMTDNFKPESEVAAHWYTVNSLAIDHETGLLASASRDKNVKVWEVRFFNLALIATLADEENGSHTHSVNSVIWVKGEHGRQIVSASDDSTLRIWNADME